MSDNKPEQQSTLTKDEPSKVEKVEKKDEVKPKESRKEGRRKRVQKLLQVLGFPSSGVGIFATLHFLRIGELEKAAIAALLTVGVTVIAVARKFISNLINTVLDRFFIFKFLKIMLITPYFRNRQYLNCYYLLANKW